MSNQKNSQKRKKNIRKKIINVTALILIIAIAATFIIFKFTDDDTIAGTTVTTYNVEEVTYGDVSTTISGSGSLSPIKSKTITTEYPAEVVTLNYAVGDSVAEGDVIAVITSDLDGDVEITAPFDGIIIEQPVAEEDELNMNEEIAILMGTDGFNINMTVDELNISSVELGQEVSVTIDAVDGRYTGSVTSISYNGSTSGSVTSYSIVATIEYVEGVYPGMSASAEIIIESSGDGLLVPVTAVKTSGDDSYLYLAPSDAEVGLEYQENEIDVSKLTKVTVKTGMSDGSYIMVESDKLSEGSLIIITKITSTLTGSESEDSNNFGMGDFSGFGGGNFDMENFDPSNMPQRGSDGSGGGFPFGN